MSQLTAVLSIQSFSLITLNTFPNFSFSKNIVEITVTPFVNGINSAMLNHFNFPLLFFKKNSLTFS